MNFITGILSRKEEPSNASRSARMDSLMSAVSDHRISLGTKLSYIRATQQDPTSSDVMHKLLEHNVRKKAHVQFPAHDGKPASPVIPHAELLAVLMPFSVGPLGTAGHKTLLKHSLQSVKVICTEFMETYPPYGDISRGQASYFKAMRAMLGYAQGTLEEARRDGVKSRDTHLFISNPSEWFFKIGQMMPEFCETISELLVWVAFVEAALGGFKEEGNAKLPSDPVVALLKGITEAQAYPTKGMGGSLEDDDRQAKSIQASSRAAGTQTLSVSGGTLVDHLVLLLQFPSPSYGWAAAVSNALACSTGYNLQSRDRLSPSASLHLRVSVLSLLMSFDSQHVSQRFGAKSAQLFAESAGPYLHKLLVASDPSPTRIESLSKEERTALNHEMQRWPILVRRAAREEFNVSVIGCMISSQKSSVCSLLMGTCLRVLFEDSVALQRPESLARLEFLFNPLVFNGSPDSCGRLQVLLLKRVLQRPNDDVLLCFFANMRSPQTVAAIQNNSFVRIFLSKHLPRVVNKIAIRNNLPAANGANDGSLVVGCDSLATCLSPEALVELAACDLERVSNTRALSILSESQWPRTIPPSMAIQFREVIFSEKIEGVERFLQAFISVTFSEKLPLLQFNDVIGDICFSVLGSFWIRCLHAGTCERVTLFMRVALSNQNLLNLLQEHANRFCNWLKNSGSHSQSPLDHLTCLHNLMKLALFADAVLARYDLYTKSNLPRGGNKGQRQSYARAAGKGEDDSRMAEGSRVLSIVLRSCMDVMRASEGDPFFQKNPDLTHLFLASQSAQFFPYFTSLNEVEIELCNRASQSVTLVVNKRAISPISKFVANSSLAEVEGYLASIELIVSAGDDGSKKAFDEMSKQKEVLARLLSESCASATSIERLWLWIENVQSELLRYDRDLAANLRSILDPIFASCFKLKSLRGEELCLRVVSERELAAAAIETELLGNFNSEQRREEVRLLLLNPIKEGRYYSALFYGFFILAVAGQGAARCAPVNTAMCEALAWLNRYFNEPMSTKLPKFALLHLSVEDEMKLLKHLWVLRDEPENFDVKTALENVHLQETIMTTSNLLQMQGLSKRFDDGVWGDAETQATLVKSCSADVMRVWKSIIEVPSFVVAMRDVLQIVNPDALTRSNMSEKDIVATYERILANSIDKVLERMRGMVGGSDASYDVLNSFRHFVPILTALLLSEHFPLAARLSFLSHDRFKVESKDTSPNVIQMLKQHLTDVKRIIEIEGSTSETGRIKTELAIISSDKNARIAICVCPNASHLSFNPLSSAASSPHHAIASACDIATALSNDMAGGRQFANLSVRLFITADKTKNGEGSPDRSQDGSDGDALKELHSDDRLVAFEERVVMVSDSDDAAKFSLVWQKAQSLLPLIAEAQWFGLQNGSVSAPFGQKELLGRLPLRPHDGEGAFYIASTPLQPKMNEVIAMVDRFYGDIKRFTDTRRAQLAKEDWLLAFPRQLGNTLLNHALIEASLPLDLVYKTKRFLEAIKVDTQFFADAENEDADGATFAQLKKAVLESPAYRELLTKKIKTQTHPKILWYDGTIATKMDDNNKVLAEAKLKGKNRITPLTLGDAMRFAMSSYKKWSPTPFELFWCTDKTSSLDVNRLRHCMNHFKASTFTIVSVDALAPSVYQELLRSILELGDGAPSVMILTGGTEKSVLQLRSDLGGADLINEKKELVIPKPPANLLIVDEEGAPRCTFIVGDFRSGKSFYAKQNATEILPHSGDALDLTMTLDFFKQKQKARASEAGGEEDVDDENIIWIDVNGYMISPTQKDPYKLVRLNQILLMLIHFRVLIDDVSGAIVPIRDNTRFLVEVPPQMMFLDAENIPERLKADPSLYLPSCAHFAKIHRTTSDLCDFNACAMHRQVATALETIMNPPQEGEFAFLIEGEGEAHDLSFDWKEHADPLGVIKKAFQKYLLPRFLIVGGLNENLVKLTCQGDLATFLQLLYYRFAPLFKGPYMTSWMNTAVSLSACLERIVKDVSSRFQPGFDITCESILRDEKFLFLPSTETFMAFPANAPTLTGVPKRLCEGSIASRIEALAGVHKKGDEQIEAIRAVLRQRGEHCVPRNMRPDEKKAYYHAEALRNMTLREVDLCNILTGEGNVPDLIALQEAFDDLGFVNVDDMLARAIHCVERQLCRVPLVIQGQTGVGKSFLLSVMFRVRIQYAIRRAKDILNSFVITEILLHELAVNEAEFRARLAAAGWPSATANPTADALLDKHIACREKLFGPLESMVTEHFPRVLERVANVDGFYQRFDTLVKDLENYPVLVWPDLPRCMVTAPRDFGDRLSMLEVFGKLMTTTIPTEYKLVAHPDTSRADIIRLLEGPVKLAMALKKSADPRVNSIVVPVVFDECNTVIETAGLMKTIMVDNRIPLIGSRSIASDAEEGDLGIWFVGAINRKSEEYKTQRLSPSLEASVAVFPGISDKDQRKSYVQQTLNRCADFLGHEEFDKIREELVNMILSLHSHSEALVREKQSKHVVSQREFHKIDAVIRSIYYLLSSQKLGKKEGDLDEFAVTNKGEELVHVCITAVYYVYIARIRDSNVRANAKALLEHMCKTGDIYNTYFSHFRDKSLVDAARKRIVHTISSRETFELLQGVALTDTLRENVFLTLLACVSEKKYKLSLAIIGDSGMGKTLSNRTVERNLLGHLSKTDFCKRFPKARFFYIQGATTTTSEQVSRVCERAQQDQERNTGCRSVVSFDEASLPQSENLVQKSLHEPVDRKIISIIVLSNKEFDDEANQNRFLVVWNESLLEEEVQELTAGCLQIDHYDRNPDSECPFRSKVVAMTRSYFALRESKDSSLRSLQMRDYVYLLKYLATAGPNGQFGPQHLKEGLEINYGTSCGKGLPEVMQVFFKQMRDAHPEEERGLWKDLAPDPIEVILERSYARYQENKPLAHRPRFKIIIDPSETYCMADAAVNIMRRVATENNPHQEIEFVTVSELEGDKQRLFEARVLSKLRVAMEKGNHVVIRNPLRLLSYLFDVLNLNYTAFVTGEGEVIERAIVALGAETAFFDVHPLFLITFVFNAKTITDLETSNVPFLSRCEKYPLRIDYDAEYCAPVMKFAEEFIGLNNISMFHKELTVGSAVSSTANGEIALAGNGGKRRVMSPEHVFRANCRLLNLVGISTFLRTCGKLTRQAEYTREYLAQFHFSLRDLIKGVKRNSCTFVTVSDSLSLRAISKSKVTDAHLLDVDSFNSFEALSSSLSAFDKSQGSLPILLVVTSKRRHSPDFMWSLCNEVRTRANTGRPYIVVASSPCKVTAVFSDKWQFVNMDSCESSQIALVLLKSYVSDASSSSSPAAVGMGGAEFSGSDIESPKGSVSSPTSSVYHSLGERAIEDIAQQVVAHFVHTYQPMPYTHYSKLDNPLASLLACVEMRGLHEVFMDALIDGLAPARVNVLIEDCVTAASDSRQSFMAILHRRSKDAFAEAARPFLRILASSPLVEAEVRTRITTRKEMLRRVLAAYKDYCDVLHKSGDKRCFNRAIVGAPDNCGGFRHPISAWFFPMVWHAVVSAQVKDTTKSGDAIRLLHAQSMDRFKDIVYLNMLQPLTEEDRHEILLDVLQHCGLIPAVMDPTISAADAELFEVSIIKAIRKAEQQSLACGSAIPANEDPFLRTVVFAANSAVGQLSPVLRKDVMTQIFLGYLQESIGVGSGDGKGANEVVCNVANSIINLSSFGGDSGASLQSSYGMSLLFSFLFRSQFSATATLGKRGRMAVLSLLSDLETTLTSGPEAAKTRAALFQIPEKDSSPLSLEGLSQFFSSRKRNISISALTWYLSGVMDLASLPYNGGTMRSSHCTIVADIVFWVRELPTATSRPFFWEVLETLIESLFEASCPSRLLEEKDHLNHNALHVTAHHANLLVEELRTTYFVDAAASYYLASEDDLFKKYARMQDLPAEDAAATPADEEEEVPLLIGIQRLLLDRFAARALEVLKGRSSENKLSLLSQVYASANNTPIVTAGIFAAACSVCSHEKNRAVEVIQKLSKNGAFPFGSRVDPASGAEVFNDSKYYMLLAYYQRRHTAAGTYALIKDGSESIPFLTRLAVNEAAAKRQALLFSLPLSIADSKEYESIVNLIDVPGEKSEDQLAVLASPENRRFVLHALRQMVFLTQEVDPDYSAAKRAVFVGIRSKLTGGKNGWSVQAVKAFDLLLHPVSKVANDIYIAMKTTPEKVGGLVESWITPSLNNMALSSLLSFVMVEMVSRQDANAKSPLNFWDAMLLTPRILKGKCVFGDLGGYTVLVHGFDCGAKFDDVTGARKSSPCSSMPILDHQYTLFACLYASILCYCLLEPANAAGLEEHVVTTTMLADFRQDLPRGLTIAVAAATACGQHFRFLTTARAYTDQSLGLHLMMAFAKSMAAPPPLFCVNDAEGDRQHQRFASYVPTADVVSAEVRVVSKRVDDMEWQQKVLAISERLPLLDAPICSRDFTAAGTATVGVGLLEEYNKALTSAQAAPPLAFVYSTLNALAPRLTWEKDSDPLSITFNRMLQLASLTDKIVINEGIAAFNVLLQNNDGQLAVECGAQELPPLRPESTIEGYVTKSLQNETNQMGIFMHAFDAIDRQVPSGDSMRERIGELAAGSNGFDSQWRKDFAQRVSNLGKRGLITQSATFWAMSHASTNVSDRMKKAPFTILWRFGRSASGMGDGNRNRQLLAAITNFFILPAMQIQVQKEAIRDVFRFPKQPEGISADDDAEAADKMAALEMRVRELLATKLAEKDGYFTRTAWPAGWDRDLFRGTLANAIKGDLSLRRSIFTVAEKVLPELVPDAYHPLASSRLLESSFIVDEKPFYRALRDCVEAAGGGKEALLKMLHLPSIIQMALEVANDPFLNQAKTFVTNASYQVMLSDSAHKAFVKRVLEHGTASAASELIIFLVDELNTDQPAHETSLSELIEIFAGEESWLQMVGVADDPSAQGENAIRLCHLAHVAATLSQCVAIDFQAEHERKIADCVYDLDLPEEVRRKSAPATADSVDDEEDKAVDGDEEMPAVSHEYAEPDDFADMDAETFDHDNFTEIASTISDTKTEAGIVKPHRPSSSRDSTVEEVFNVHSVRFEDVSKAAPTVSVPTVSAATSKSAPRPKPVSQPPIAPATSTVASANAPPPAAASPAAKQQPQDQNPSEEEQEDEEEEQEEEGEEADDTAWRETYGAKVHQFAVKTVQQLRRRVVILHAYSYALMPPFSERILVAGERLPQPQEDAVVICHLKEKGEGSTTEGARGDGGDKRFTISRHEAIPMSRLTKDFTVSDAIVFEKAGRALKTGLHIKTKNKIVFAMPSSEPPKDVYLQLPGSDKAAIISVGPLLTVSDVTRIVQSAQPKVPMIPTDPRTGAPLDINDLAETALPLIGTKKTACVFVEAPSQNSFAVAAVLSASHFATLISASAAAASPESSAIRTQTSRTSTVIASQPNASQSTGGRHSFTIFGNSDGFEVCPVTEDAANLPLLKPSTEPFAFSVAQLVTAHTRLKEAAVLSLRTATNAFCLQVNSPPPSSSPSSSFSAARLVCGRLSVNVPSRSFLSSAAPPPLCVVEYRYTVNVSLVDKKDGVTARWSRPFSFASPNPEIAVADIKARIVSYFTADSKEVASSPSDIVLFSATNGLVVGCSSSLCRRNAEGKTFGNNSAMMISHKQSRDLVAYCCLGGGPNTLASFGLVVRVKFEADPALIPVTAPASSSYARVGGSSFEFVFSSETSLRKVNTVIRREVFGLDAGAAAPASPHSSDLLLSDAHSVWWRGLCLALPDVAHIRLGHLMSTFPCGFQRCGSAESGDEEESETLATDWWCPPPLQRGLQVLTSQNDDNDNIDDDDDDDNENAEELFPADEEEDGSDADENEGAEELFGVEDDEDDAGEEGSEHDCSTTMGSGPPPIGTKMSKDGAVTSALPSERAPLGSSAAKLGSAANVRGGGDTKTGSAARVFELTMYSRCHLPSAAELTTASMTLKRPETANSHHLHFVLDSAAAGGSGTPTTSPSPSPAAAPSVYSVVALFSSLFLGLPHALVGPAITLGDEAEGQDTPTTRNGIFYKHSTATDKNTITIVAIPAICAYVDFPNRYTSEREAFTQIEVLLFGGATRSAAENTIAAPSSHLKLMRGLYRFVSDNTVEKDEKDAEADEKLNLILASIASTSVGLPLIRSPTLCEFFF